MRTTTTVDPTEGHTARTLDFTLGELRLQAVALGGLAIDQVSVALSALLSGDSQQALLVLERESRVDQLYRQLDRDSFALIAMHQPMAGDLRLVRAVSRIGIELERTGDEAKKIARFAMRISRGEPAGPIVAVNPFLRHMATLSADMLRNAVRALDETDLALADSVVLRDAELDEEFQSALRKVFTLAMEGAPYLRATIDTVLALKGLERIGDHAKTIARQVCFSIRGESTQGF
jgi:phosphate transport system protein